MNVLSLFTFNRVLARRLTGVLVKTPLTPNAVTVLSCLSGLLAAASMSHGTRAGLIAGALFLHLSFILDDCDGEMARLKSLSSVFGMWLDYAADLVVDLALWLGLAVGAWRSGASVEFALILAICASVGSIGNFFRVVSSRKGKPHPSTNPPESNARGFPQKSVWMRAYEAAASDGDPSILVWILALIGSPILFLLLGCFYIQLLWFKK